jgi:excisionase family DNA binding protein
MPATRLSRCPRMDRRMGMSFTWALIEQVEPTFCFPGGVQWSSCRPAQHQPPSADRATTSGCASPNKFPSIHSPRRPLLETLTTTILLKGDDVAQILQVSRSFAYQLMRRGDLPTVRLGHAVRVRPADLDAFIAASITGNSTSWATTGGAR